MESDRANMISDVVTNRKLRVRAALLSLVDVIEEDLGIQPTTVALRKQHKCAKLSVMRHDAAKVAELRSE